MNEDIIDSPEDTHDPTIRRCDVMNVDVVGMIQFYIILDVQKPWFFAILNLKLCSHQILSPWFEHGTCQLTPRRARNTDHKWRQRVCSCSLTWDTNYRFEVMSRILQKPWFFVITILKLCLNQILPPWFEYGTCQWTPRTSSNSGQKRR